MGKERVNREKFFIQEGRGMKGELWEVKNDAGDGLRRRGSFFISIFGLSLLILACPQPGGHVPEPAKPDYIEIRNAADLGKIGKEYPLNGSYQIGSGEIRVSNWTPIGTETAPFTGKFGGNGGGRGH
jgi:hypothetical protein